MPWFSPLKSLFRGAPFSMNPQQYYQEPTGTIYWNVQIVAGYVFSLGKDWGLDTGIE
jgi:hypothetical protein